MVYNNYYGGIGAKNAMSILEDTQDVLSFGYNLNDLLTKYPVCDIKEANKLNQTEKKVDHGNCDNLYAGISSRVDIELDTLQLTYMYLGILFHMTSSIEVLQPPAGFDKKKARSAFQTILAPNASLPRLNGMITTPSLGLQFESSECLPWTAGPITPPALGPLTSFGKCGLERFSKTNAILRSIACVLAPTQWAEFTKNHVFPATEIHNSNIPL